MANNNDDDLAGIQVTQAEAQRGKLHALSRANRILTAFSLAWTPWVVFRTSGYQDLFGLRLPAWSADMFLVNLLLPPFVLWASMSLYKWIQAADH